MRRAEEHVMDCANREINCSKYDTGASSITVCWNLMKIYILNATREEGLTLVVSSNLASTNYNFE